MSLLCGSMILLLTLTLSSRRNMPLSVAEPVQDMHETLYFPSGHEQRTENSTYRPPGLSSNCRKGYFFCNTSAICLELSRKCDGIVHCLNAEDETNCVCAFRLPPAKFCDKYPDCFDQSDEIFCSYCPLNHFNCGDGTCIPRNNVCDLRIHCSNGMDENFCFRLSLGTPELTTEHSHKQGFLFRNQNGVWYPLCAHRYDAMQDALATHACISITSNPLVSTSYQHLHFTYPLLDASRGFLYHISGGYVQWKGCLSDEGIFVSCGDALCGFNPKLLLPKPRIARIVGGEVSIPGSWPWHAAIYKNGTYDCGGTLINGHWLLSASHCFLDFEANYYEVQLGMARRRSFTPHQKTYRVERIVTHNNFNIVTLDFDIALIKTAEEISFDFWIRPICLPNRRKIENAGTYCTAIGWGNLGERDGDSDDLQEVHVPLMPSCRNSDRWICAGYIEGGRDACQGDSGGPLMCLQEDGVSWYIVGVISAGTGCARPQTPGMYTRVVYYVQWIERILEQSEFPAESPLRTCPGWRCPALGGGNCLPQRKVCDGHVDCYDAGDEVDCLHVNKKRKTSV